jgi:hypothetical protein
MVAPTFEVEGGSVLRSKRASQCLSRLARLAAADLGAFLRKLGALWARCRVSLADLARRRHLGIGLPVA